MPFIAWLTTSLHILGQQTEPDSGGSGGRRQVVAVRFSATSLLRVGVAVEFGAGDLATVNLVRAVSETECA